MSATDLGESMRDVVAAIGYSPTLSLIHVYSGRLYVPLADNLTEDHHIARLLGMPLAKLLARAVGGQTIKIPVGDRLLWQCREAEIARRFRGGASVSEIVREFRVSERYACYAKARSKRGEI